MSEKKYKILIADDDPEIQEFVKLGLTFKNYEVVTANDGEEALKIINEITPDMIITDVNMPKIDGHELCKIIKKQNSTKFIPVIMMTAEAGTEELVKGFDAGADEFIAKPFKILELVSRIRAMFRIKSLQDELTDLNTNLEEKVIEKTKEIQSMYLRTIKAFVAAIEAKDHYTMGHCDNVTKYSLLIAEELGLSNQEIEEIGQAAQLHDLGKIGIGDHILNKPDVLTFEEREEIKKHAMKSVEILRPLIFLENIVKIVMQHHERYDGKGYPLGNTGENIPIGARILAVADSFDAMTSDRPYRKAMSKEEAIKQLEGNKGTQFDPTIVNYFLKAMDKSKK